MRRVAIVLLAMIVAVTALIAQKINMHVHNSPAGSAFAELMRMSGYNFSYDSSLLKNMAVSVDVTDGSIDEALAQMFDGTEVEWTVSGGSVVLKRDRRSRGVRNVVVSGYVTELSSGEPLIGAIVRAGSAVAATNSSGHYSLHLPVGSTSIRVSYPGFLSSVNTIDVGSNIHVDFRLAEPDKESRKLGEVVVEADRNTHIAMHSADIGRINLTRADITATPALFGESDVIKTLQMQPGVSAGIEGLASMYVHGGANDENMYMLDNVPIYQVNHFGGLFSAFNTEAIKNVDFYKSSFPARYNGRLSSIMAVNTRDGNTNGHHGQFRLGLTSGAFSLEGPLPGGKTTYSLALRRSWFDAISVPALAIYNSVRSDKENTTTARYAFMDANAKITHNFSNRSRLHLMFYYGDDYLKGGSGHKYFSITGLPKERRESDVSRLKWGNTVVSAGWRMQWSDILWSELTASYSHYRSMMRNNNRLELVFGDGFDSTNERDYRFRSRITDWSLRGDFGLSPAAGHNLTFGASYTIHRFVPMRETTKLYEADSLISVVSVDRYINAGEGAAYFGYSWDVNDRLRLDAGVNGGWFSSSGRTHTHLDPRFSGRIYLNDGTSLKLSYSRTSQYVHQLTQSNLDLPTDQWVPIVGDFGPQKADKIAAGVYHRFPKGVTLSAEIYYKWMHNLVDYRDDYYLLPADAPWSDLLCSGSGRAKGLDLMASRSFGKVSGHVAYSLMWADRKFADKNGGRRFPARFDNRHKINILMTWKINDRWDASAAWTGMSGNRYTISVQDYELLKVPGMPIVGNPSFTGYLDYSSSINNYRLPFYHRLDLSANRYTRRGKWTFSLYNAYCNMSVIGIRKVTNYFVDFYGLNSNYPVTTYKKYRLVPIIPSVSYTWIF